MRISGWSVTVVLAATLLAGCGDEGDDVTVEQPRTCAGFTPTGGLLGDDEVIEAAADKWAQEEDSPLAGGGTACVLYAARDRLGFPHVALVADERLGVYTGLEEDDPSIASVVDGGFVGDGRETDVPVVAVGNDRWLLSPAVRSARLVSAARSRPVDGRTVEVEQRNGSAPPVLVATTADGSFLATSTADRREDLAAVVPLPRGSVGLPALLSRPRATAVLAAAIRHARGELQYRPGALRLVATAAGPTGPVLLSEAYPDPARPSDRVRPAVSFVTADPERPRALAIGQPYERSGRLRIGDVDPGPGWAAGTFLPDRRLRPAAYVAVAAVPDESPGAVRLDVAVGDRRVERPGPMVVVPARGATTGALIATANGTALPTLPMESARD